MITTLVQLNPEWENPQKSIEQIDKLIPQIENSDLIVFPEMTLTGFSMNSVELAEELDGVSTIFFINLSRKLKTHIVAGVIEKDEDKIFNTAVHFNRDGLVAARYRKIHPFSMGNENKYYHSSKEPVITKIDNMTFGLSVCYDLRFPELYRQYAKQQVDGLINIANWPVARINHWQKLLAARAIENLSFMIGCNRSGKDPFYKYNGSSEIYNPMGEQLLHMDTDEVVGKAEIIKESVEKTRSKLNFLDDIKLI